MKSYIEDFLGELGEMFWSFTITLIVVVFYVMYLSSKAGGTEGIVPFLNKNIKYIQMPFFLGMVGIFVLMGLGIMNGMMSERGPKRAIKSGVGALACLISVYFIVTELLLK